MTRFHYNIKIPVKFDDFFPSFKNFTEIPILKTQINTEFVNWLKELSVDLDICRFFNSPPFQRYKIHKDGSGEHTTKMNIIFNSSDTFMNWYKSKGGDPLKKNNTLGEELDWLEKEQADLLYRTSVNSNCILVGNVYHDLENNENNNNIRKCYSFILKNSKTNLRLTWTEALEIFKDYIHDDIHEH